MSLHTAAFDGTFDKTCLGSSPVLKYVFLSLEYSDFLSFCPDAEEDFLALPEVCPTFLLFSNSYKNFTLTVSRLSQKMKRARWQTGCISAYVTGQILF